MGDAADTGGEDGGPAVDAGGKSGDAWGKESALEGEFGDAAGTGGEEGGPSADAGGGKFAAADSAEIVALNGGITAPFGKEIGKLHFREAESFNLARSKRGAAARLGPCTGLEVTTIAFVDILPAGFSGSRMASTTILLAETVVLGVKKMEYIFFGIRQRGETFSGAGSAGSTVTTESTGTLAGAESCVAPSRADEISTDPVEQPGQTSKSHMKQRSPTAPATISALQMSQDRFDFLYSLKRHMCPPGQTRPLKSGQAFRRMAGSYEERNVFLLAQFRGVPKPYCEA